MGEVWESGVEEGAYAEDDGVAGKLGGGTEKFGGYAITGAVGGAAKRTGGVDAVVEGADCGGRVEALLLHGAPVLRDDYKV